MAANLNDKLAELRERGELALTAYLMGGYPTLPTFRDHLLRVSASGADVIEVGVPFSDPMADGPVIQYASQTALSAGARLSLLLELLAQTPVAQPLVLMSYLNPLMRLEHDSAAAVRRMRDAGVQGLIIPDLPVEESDAWLAACRAGGVHLVYLAAPTSTPQRLSEIGSRSDAFVYAVSITGTTGVRSGLSAELPEFLQRLRRATHRPLLVGFGISTPQDVAALRPHADGVVVGSRLVQAIRDGDDLGALVRDLKRATQRDA